MKIDANSFVAEHGADEFRKVFDGAWASKKDRPPVTTPSSVVDFPKKATGPAGLQTQSAASFNLRSIRWLWPNRFALGKLGLIGGLPDKGKGLISADMIARTTTGAQWPCNEGEAPKGNVIWFTAEDDIADTVIPRLAAAGADLDRVHIIGMARNPNGSTRMFNLATDLPLLRHKLDLIGGVTLVVM